MPGRFHGGLVKRHWRDYAFLVVVVGCIVFLDQWTKALVRENLPLGHTWLPKSLDWLAPYARIVHWYNTGAAFGMFRDAGLVFTVLAFVVAAAILYYYPRIPADDWSLRVALGMQLGGALGNLIDRLTLGQVTDFLSVGSFPVFNLADASITLGVAVLLLGVWIKERAEKQKAQVRSEAGNLQDENPVTGEESVRGG
ncbi:MAG: signal peptidase II [Anaerolineae bacterium]|nr:MAG: signal peptidase II [Anaerolineae bacterium]